MYKIKTHNMDLYRKLLDDRSKSWIESGGWYLPSHIPISWRLHKAIIERDDPVLISHNFKLLHIALVGIWVVSFIAFILFGLISLLS